MGLYDMNKYTYRLGPAVNQIGKVTLGSVLGPPTQGLFHGSPVLERLKCHSGQLHREPTQGHFLRPNGQNARMNKI